MSLIHPAATPSLALGPGARPWLVGAGLAAAVALRTAVGGEQAAASPPGALGFGVAVILVALAAGWRPARPAAGSIAAGAAGALVLVALAVSARGGVIVRAAASAPELATWVPVVVSVAIAEEILLRGVLFVALMERGGPIRALVLTSAAFALIHVPLYGTAALPLDFAVGCWLGGLRLLTGGVGAPATAHALADLAAGWLL